MSSFNAGGVRIAYEDQGDGAPLILVHGFAASFETNWVAPGWGDRCVAEGRRVVGLDCRGHGASEKPHDPSAYAASHRTVHASVCGPSDSAQSLSLHR